MNNILIIGSGGHAVSCIDVIEQNNKFTILGYVDNNKSNSKLSKKYKYIGNDNDLKKINEKCKNAVIGIGQIKDYKIRSNLYLELKNIGYNLPVIISPLSYVSKNCTLGESTIVMHHALINNQSSILENCIINSKVLVEHNCYIGPNTHLAPGVIICGDVNIEGNTFIGSGTIVKQGIKIGKNCIISAGKYISNDIPSNQLIK